jgi:adenylate kinase
MRILLFGPPGVGKGTQAQLLADKYNMVRISTGDLLREEVSLSSPIGRRVEQYLRKGHLVPDDIMFEIMDSMLMEYRERDILFDGFPRNLNQARSLEKSLAQLDQTINMAFEMHLDEDELIDRLINRRYCPKCGRIYNYYRSLGIYRKVNAQGGQEDVFARISHIVDDYLNIKCRSN